LHDVAAAHVDEHAEPPAGRLVFAGRDQQVARRAPAHFGVAPVVVGRQELLHPLEAVWPERLDQLQRVLGRERHPAVVGEEELVRVAHPRAHLGGQLDVPSQTLIALGRAVDQDHLAADEAELLGEIRARPCRVELDRVPHGAADHRVHRLVAKPAEQVPEREVDRGDRVQDEPLPPVEERRSPELIPDELDLVRALALDEAREVILDEPGRRHAAGRDADADRAVVRLGLDDDGAEHVEPER
jgi:hypothetical protein